MRYVFAILLPPLAVFLCGRRFQAVVSLVLTLCFWLPGVIHALFIVKSYFAGTKGSLTVDQMRAYQLNSVLRRS